MRLIAITMFFVIGLVTMGFSQNGAYILGHQSDNTIGSSVTDNAHAITPFTIGRKDARSHYLYLRDELIYAGASAGTITSISFQVTNIPASTIPIANFKVSIGTTSATTLSSTLPAPNTFPVYKTVSNLLISETGWYKLDLDTDFIWNGIDNIIVEVCKTDTNYTPSSFEVQATRFPSGDNRTAGFYTRINSNPAGITGCNMQAANSSQNVIGVSSSDRRIRPDIKFIFACNGTPASGVVVRKSPSTVCYGEAIELKIVDGSQSSGLTYQWECSPTSSVNFAFIPGATNAELTVTKGEVDKYYRRRTICGGSSVNSTSILIEGVNTWDGTNWSKGTQPAPDESVIFNGNYLISSDMEFCSVYVNSGQVTVANGITLKVANEIKVNAGLLLFEDGSNLIQINPIANNGGVISYKRNSQPVRRFDYTYWSSPVLSQTLVGFSPQTLPDKYFSWNHMTQAWLMESPSNTMTAGKGYIIRAPQPFATTGTGTVFSGAFTGKPNNGDITLPISGAGTWNLIGNPYPSALDAVSLLTNTNNQSVLDATLYFWTHNTAPSQIPGNAIYNYTAADYATYNFTGGVGTGSAATTIGNIQEPTRYIGAGQSFMVKGFNAGGTAVFNNSMRTSINNSQFFRNNTSTNELERHRFWLELTNQQSVFKQILIGYIDGATEGLDRGFDGQTLDSNNFSFFSLVEDSTRLTIQGKGLPFDESDSVALGFKANSAGNHIISLYQFDGLFENQNIYLEDTYTNIIQNLKEGNYQFTSSVGTFLDRFIIRYSNTTLGTSEQNSTLNSVFAFKRNNQIIINSTNDVLKQVKIFDMSGRILYDNKVENSKQTAIPSAQWSNQLLMIEVSDIDKNIKKIIKIVN